MRVLGSQRCLRCPASLTLRAAQPTLGALLLASSLHITAASAQDEPIELADDPFEISDPIAAAPGSAEVAFVGVYERARTGRIRNTLGVETELELGVIPRLELRLGQTGAYGNLETRRRLGAIADLTDAPLEREQASKGGTSRIGIMYQLTDNQGRTPAIAVLGRVRSLYGPGRTTYEAENVLLIGKTILRGDRAIGLHINLGWTTRLGAQPGERPSRYLLNASLGQAITGDTALVVTYALSQQERGDRDYSLIQAGVRHRLAGSDIVLGLAVGAGLNRDTPRFQISFALQLALNDGGL